MLAPCATASDTQWLDLAALRAIESEWTVLIGRAIAPNVFYEPGFLLSAAAVFCPDAGAVTVRTKAGRLIGLFPMHRDRARYGGYPAPVCGLVHPYGPLGAPLVDTEFAEMAIAGWLDHLCRTEHGAGAILLPFFPQHGRLAALLDRAVTERGLRQKHFNRHARAMLVRDREAADERASVGMSKMRKEWRRQRRRLLERGPLEHRIATTPTETGALLDVFLALEAKGWKGHAGTAAAQNPGMLGFMRDAVVALARAGQARIDVLRTDGQPVAATVTLFSKDEGWLWKIAFDEDFARFSPGVQLTLDVSGNLLADPRIARVDSCATPNHPMIDRLWPGRLALSDRMIALRPGFDPRFAVACALEAVRACALPSLRRARTGLRHVRIRRARAATGG